MYLSGPPLHVLAMHCVERWRAAFGGAVPLSFSGGIDQHNVVDAVACDFVPVTTCTDLLRPGGYGRLGKYLENLEEAMVACGARDRDELDLQALRQGRRGGAARRRRASKSRASRVDATERRARIVRMAGVLNSHEVAARVTGDPRYAAGKNGKPPRKVGSMLVLLDCLSCDKCVPVCPNDANFAIDTPPEELAYEDVVVDAAGAVDARRRRVVDGEEGAAVGQLRRRVQRVRQLRRVLSRGRRAVRDEGALLRIARELRRVARRSTGCGSSARRRRAARCTRASADEPCVMTTSGDEAARRRRRACARATTAARRDHRRRRSSTERAGRIGCRARST